MRARARVRQLGVPVGRELRELTGRLSMRRRSVCFNGGCCAKQCGGNNAAMTVAAAFAGRAA